MAPGETAVEAEIVTARDQDAAGAEAGIEIDAAGGLIAGTEDIAAEAETDESGAEAETDGIAAGAGTEKEDQGGTGAESPGGAVEVLGGRGSKGSSRGPNRAGGLLIGALSGIKRDPRVSSMSRIVLVHRKRDANFVRCNYFLPSVRDWLTSRHKYYWV